MIELFHKFTLLMMKDFGSSGGFRSDTSFMTNADVPLLSQEGLGLGDEVYSPTFALVNEYRGEQLSLIHFDMYRILSPEDLETTGFFDYMSDDSVLAIEWSENIADELPEGIIKISFERTGDETRKITVSGDERF